MKKNFNALTTVLAFIFVSVVIVACDKDYNTIGSDIIGDKNFSTANAFYSATSYNKKLNPVRTSGLPSYLLGVYNDPIYGSTTSNIVTQLVPQTYTTDFGENVVVDSVVLNIPYYSKVASNSPDDDGNILYTISDSLYGELPVKLSVYRSDYYLRDFDPGSDFDDQQYYYSNANSTINFDSHIVDMLFKNDLFLPSSDAIPQYAINESTQVFEEKERLAPALRIKSLDTDYWKETIIDRAGDAEISNRSNFVNYFRSVYFKTEAITPDGNTILLNMASTSANITIYYSYDSTVTTGERDTSTYTMLFSGINLNTYDNTFDIPLEDGDPNLGDEKLHIKGGEGSMAIIDLFGNIDDDDNGIPDELDEFRSHKDEWLINEANLVVYEDETINSPSEDFHKYDRLYLYDINNNRPLFDYFLDPSSNDISPVNSRIIHLGQRITEENGISRFKFRITEHLNNILLKDSTNTKLGLVFSTNVNLVQNGNILDGEDEDVDVVPFASTISPKGTILYGSNMSVPENKRIQLEIFYTKPNNF